MILRDGQLPVFFGGRGVISKRIPAKQKPAGKKWCARRGIEGKNEGSNFYYPGPVFEILEIAAQPEGEK